jgi:UDP-glucose:(heptosyl)LPS alpha-1,3-glucosyltransferase
MEKTMKFATAIAHFSRSKGGAERYLVGLCNRMAEEGHDVHVYAEDWEEDIPGVSLHRVKTIPFPKSLKLLSFAIKATREMKAGNYGITLGVGNTLEADVLQPHGGVHRAWFWRSLKAYDSPILWAIKFLGRVLSPKQWIQGYIESAPYKKGTFKKIIAISDMVKEDILKWYNIPEDRIVVIYNGVDTERFHPGNYKYRSEIRNRHGIGEEFVVLFVSNNFRMKGLHQLIKALAKLKKDENLTFKLLILGRNPQAPYLHLGRELGLSGEIVFAGSTDEPEKYYGASDLLAHPTFYDACSLTVLEALASGLPVITTAWNGASGVIAKGQEGLVLSDPRDSHSLAERLLFLSKRENRQKLSDTDEFIDRYSEIRNWQALKAIFEQAVSERKTAL